MREGSASFHSTTEVSEADVELVYGRLTDTEVVIPTLYFAEQCQARAGVAIHQSKAKLQSPK